MIQFSPLSADGQSAALTITSGVYRYTVNDGHGGGTSVLQLQEPTGDWIDVPDTSFTAAGVVNINLVKTATLRVSLSGSTGASLSGSLE